MDTFIITYTFRSSGNSNTILIEADTVLKALAKFDEEWYNIDRMKALDIKEVRQYSRGD